MKLIPIILSGGVGSRLWPLSRELTPKQFLPLAHHENSLLQETVLRVKDDHIEKPIIVCNSEHRFIIAEQIREVGIEPAKIILEPIGKNTAPAVAVAALTVLKQEDAVLAILPADHKIDNTQAFHESLMLAAEYAAQGYLATFGVIPHKPETGYGYIQAGNTIVENRAYQVNKFVEKPDTDTAQAFLKSGDFYWNSGMFVFQASTYLAELEKFAPDIMKAAKDAYSKAQQDLDFIRLDQEAFEKCPSDSIDYAVMEHTNKAIVVPVDCQWSDVGSWAALWESQTQDELGNVTHGDVIVSDVQNCYLRSEDRMLVAVGLKDSVVIETSDAVLVADKHHTQEVKKIVEHLKEKEREEAISHRLVYRPWGSYETLVEGPGYKVKRITVKPGASLSLQSHHHRSEHWVIVKGVAEVTRGDEVLTLKHDESTYLPVETKHRLNNPGNILLELIEVQSGEYLGEDDIVRYEDRYGRV